MNSLRHLVVKYVLALRILMQHEIMQLSFYVTQLRIVFFDEMDLHDECLNIPKTYLVFL